MHGWSKLTHTNLHGEGDMNHDIQKDKLFARILTMCQCSASVEKVLAINDRYTEILVLLFKNYRIEGVKLVLQPIQILGRRYHQ